ncbi:O-antigen ligase family protein [Pontibacter arcticus]|uniref:O-antigen ligase-related domain-containing protein n=1 Tax=Pontibacter arcticus TaxID=2080288 RepID=A0A364RDJ4_9BACT|nr:O-antigen ligase family protein [Pontibacter arcticus]RAU82418.1 hypothetical protein DP923_11580 [Pontibacter arcticus]
MVREYLAQTGPEIVLENRRKMQLDWGFILTILAVASTFLGNSLVRLDLGIFTLYPLRLLGFMGVFYMLINQKWDDPFLSFTSKFIFFMMILGFISIFWAPDTVLAIKEFGVLQTGLTLTWLLTKYINTEKRVELVLLIWVLGAILVNMIGLWEVVNQKFLIVEKMGGKLEREIERIGALAPRSIFVNQNNYAFFNAITAPVLLGMFVKKTRPLWHYLVTGFSLALSVYLLISSYSRAAMGGFALALIFFAVFTFFTKSNHKISVLKLLGIAAIAIALIVAVNTSLLDVITNKLDMVVEKNNQRTDESRADIYAENLALVANNLGIGMGPGSSYDKVDNLPPHNFFLQILVEYGLVTVLGFLWIFYRVFKRYGLYKQVMPDALPYILRASILAFPLMSIGPSSIVGEGIFWLWFGFIIAYSSIMLRKYCSVLPPKEID